MGRFLVSLIATLSAIPAAAGFVAWILFIIFGQVTVRKLRKNPETKHELGIEFASGWDIFNVASACCRCQKQLLKGSDVTLSRWGWVLRQIPIFCTNTRRCLIECWRAYFVYYFLFPGLG